MEAVVVLVIVVGLIAAAGWVTKVRREVTAREKALVEERAALELQMRQRETFLEQRDVTFRQGYVSGRKWLAACIAEWRQSIDESRENYLRSKPRPGEKSAEVVRVVKTEKRALQTELKFLQYQLAAYEEYFPFLEEYKEAILDERVALGADRNNIEELEAADLVQLLLEPEGCRVSNTRLQTDRASQLSLLQRGG